tara:strand:+ start:79 stop:2508 length:2430 start_codon:yes stop_codon:yes gene_type:complete
MYYTAMTQSATSLAKWRDNLVIHSFDRIDMKLSAKKEWIKDLVGQSLGWSSLKTRKTYKYHNALGCLTGQPSGIIVLDFDDITMWQEWIKLYPILDEVPRVATRKGFHLYFKWLDKYTELPSRIINPNGGGNIDIQKTGQQVIYPPTKYTYIDGTIIQYIWDKAENEELQEIPDDLYDRLNKDNIKKKPLTIIEGSSLAISQKVSNQDIEMAKLMDKQKYFGPGSYDEWTKTIWALKNSGFSYDFAKELSNFDDNVDEDKLKQIWQSKTDKNTVKLGTIYAQAKLSSPFLYYRIKIKYMDPIVQKPACWGEWDLANLVIKEADGCFVYSNGQLMVYTDNFWYADPEYHYTKELLTKIGKKYINQCIGIYSKYQKFIIDDPELGDTDSDTAYKKKLNLLSDILVLLNKTNWRTNLAKEIKTIIINQKKDIEFDTKGHLIAFKNIKYNFETKEFEPILKEDYISTTTNYNWIEPKQEEYDLIKTILSQIFPNEEIRKCYLSIMRTALQGYVKSHFTVANGCGSNGKGVINDLLMTMLGDYAMDGEISILIKLIGAGANPALANMNKKRFVLFKEPNCKDKILLGNMKMLVDNDSVSARALYSSNCLTLLRATFILECNKKLNFDGEVDNSEYRRFLDILFESTFVDKDSEHLKNKNIINVFEGNNDYKQSTWKNNHKCALFKYIINKAPEQVYKPACVEQRTKEYVDSNDLLLTWISDHYIYDVDSETDYFVQVKDMYYKFKSGDEWDNLYKKERPTLKKFISDVKSNSNFKLYYHERKRIKGTDCRNILFGWRLKRDDECTIKKEDDDDE